MSNVLLFIIPYLNVKYLSLNVRIKFEQLSTSADAHLFGLCIDIIGIKDTIQRNRPFPTAYRGVTWTFNFNRYLHGILLLWNYFWIICHSWDLLNGLIFSFAHRAPAKKIQHTCFFFKSFRNVQSEWKQNIN